MKATDKFTIELTARDALRAYLILGKTNGAGGGDLWNQLGDIFGDETCNRKILNQVNDFYRLDSINYSNIQKYAEELVFKKPETEQQRKIRELEETINKAQQQIEELKNES